MIKQRLDSGAIDGKNVEELVNQNIQNHLHELSFGADAAFGFEEFRDWYQARMGKNFSLKNIAGDDGSPSTDPEANFLQKMMSAADKVREPHMLDVIAAQISEHDRVLVVCGSAHLGKQEPVLKKMIGTPQHMKAF